MIKHLWLNKIINYLFTLAVK